MGATTNLGSAVHSFPRAMPAFSCTGASCESLPASFNSSFTMSVFSREEAALGTSMQLPRQRAVLPTRISSSESSSFIKVLNTTGKYGQPKEADRRAWGRKRWVASFSRNLGKYVLSLCDPALWYSWVCIAGHGGLIPVPRRAETGRSV